jgi:O-antigen/teichoic acid export membrane protein
MNAAATIPMNGKPEPAPNELKRFLVQSSHYMLGIGGGLALGFISFPIFTRVFSIADFGMIDYIQKLLLLLTALSKGGMQNSVLRFFDQKTFATDKDAAKRYYSTVFFGVSATAGIVTILLLVVGKLPALANSTTAGLLTFASLLVFIRALQSILQSFLRIEERTKAVNVLNILIKALTIVGVLTLLFFGLSANVRSYFQIVIAVEGAIVALLTLWLLQRHLLQLSSFDTTLFRAAAIFGLPMIMHETAGIFLDAGDRFMVEYFLGPEPLGLYSVAYGLAGQVNMVMMTPLGLAIVPVYMRLWNTEGAAKTSEFLNTTLDLFLMASAGAMAAVTVLSHDAVMLMASAKYKGADELIPMIVAGLLLYAAQMFLNAGLIIHKKTYAMAAVLALSALLNFALNAWLLPQIGLKAAAIATFVSYAVCTLVLAAMTHQVLPLKLPIRKLLGYVVAATLVVVAVPFVNFGNLFLNCIGKSILSVSLYFAILFTIDSRVRSMSSKLLSRF